jgi:hypothetical protein
MLQAQTLEQLPMVCEGLTIEQIKEAIDLSVHGQNAKDPDALAMYLEALAAGEVAPGDLTEIPETDGAEPGITEEINFG